MKPKPALAIYFALKWYLCAPSAAGGIVKLDNFNSLRYGNKGPTDRYELTK